MTPCAKWTGDCQGKQDYDGRLLSISCRYWPGEGDGGSNVFDTSTMKWTTVWYGKKPSAVASISLNFGEPDECGYGNYLEWREESFEANTEAEVKVLVETWVQERMDEVLGLLGIARQEGDPR